MLLIWVSAVVHAVCRAFLKADACQRWQADPIRQFLRTSASSVSEYPWIWLFPAKAQEQRSYFISRLSPLGGISAPLRDHPGRHLLSVDELRVACGWWRKLLSSHGVFCRLNAATIFPLPVLRFERGYRHLNICNRQGPFHRNRRWPFTTLTWESHLRAGSTRRPLAAGNSVGRILSGQCLMFDRIKPPANHRRIS